ncbi:MAG TPA: G1 family glutamic endopeptidase [Acidimicrobiales bacterium]|nr:G1 family glutamic endopeptidase [Acidimicrobiales bacterium]
MSRSRSRRAGLAVLVGLATFGSVAPGAGPARASAPMKAGFHAPAGAVHGGVVRAAPHNLRAAMANSSNWSGYNIGYLDRGSLFSSISADWIVPTATQRNRGQAEFSSTWIGIGGGCVDTSCSSTDATLIQLGTEQDVDASGVPSYSDWWEVIPGPSVTVNGVEPGDHVRATLSQLAPDVWRFSLVDFTHTAGFSGMVPYSSDETTAEWIDETPLLVGSNSGMATLPNLSRVRFFNATVNGRNALLSPAEALQLGGGGTGLPVIATPSVPVPARNGFNDCSYAATCPARPS